MYTPTPNIRRGFDSHLRDVCPTLGLDWETDVAWPNIEFDPNPDKLYLRPSLILNSTDAASCGEDGFYRTSGVYQVSVLDCINVGLANGEEVAARLVKEFGIMTPITCCGFDLRITSSYMSTPMLDEFRLHIPVSVLWFCYYPKVAG